MGLLVTELDTRAVAVEAAALLTLHIVVITKLDSHYVQQYIHCARHVR